MVLLILLIVYRNPVTMLLPLITIGVSLVTAQGILSGPAQVGMAISDETIVLMTGIMAGAGTDYAVFLISRYHDYVRLGADSNQAVKRALASIGKVIAASAATVAITFLGMVFARMSVFSTVGPAMAIAIGVAFVAAVTLLPALLVLAGPRGWVRPRRDLTTRFWRRSGIRIVRRPRSSGGQPDRAAGACRAASFVRYQLRRSQDSAGLRRSAVGYAAMDRHFPLNSTLPQYLFISSRHDLRTPRALADMEQMAYRISQLPDIAMVRGITRPTGESLEQPRRPISPAKSAASSATRPSRSRPYRRPRRAESRCRRTGRRSRRRARPSRSGRRHRAGPRGGADVHVEPIGREQDAQRHRQRRQAGHQHAGARRYHRSEHLECRGCIRLGRSVLNALAQARFATPTSHAVLLAVNCSGW